MGCQIKILFQVVFKIDDQSIQGYSLKKNFFEKYELQKSLLGFW